MKKSLWILMTLLAIATSRPLHAEEDESGALPEVPGQCSQENVGASCIRDGEAGKCAWTTTGITYCELTYDGSRPLRATDTIRRPVRRGR